MVFNKVGKLFARRELNLLYVNLLYDDDDDDDDDDSLTHKRRDGVTAVNGWFAL